MLRALGAGLVRLVVVMAIMVVASTGRAGEPDVPSVHDVLAQAEAEGRACGAEEDGSASVICGGALLADLVGPEHLIMDRDTCSRLLEELFGSQSCGLGEADCGQLRALPPPPPSSRVLAGSGAAVSVVQPCPPGAETVQGLARPESEAVPLSLRARPPTPPPRG